MKETGEQIDELIDEMSYDLAECHVEFLLNGELYTDYNTMAQKMVSRGYRRRKEGEWKSEIVKRCDWKGKKQQYYQPNSCSLCHDAVLKRTPYCPYCGAKMKGGSE